MSISTLFTIAIILILLRIFWLKIKDTNMKGEGFKRLPPKDQLAVLKECLLNNPTNGNLQNLKDFCTKMKTLLFRYKSSYNKIFTIFLQSVNYSYNKN